MTTEPSAPEEQPDQRNAEAETRLLSSAERFDEAGTEAGLPPRFIVGIGASAGGLDSLEKFFRAVPPDTGLGFVVVQHLSPDYKSMMVELLSKHTPMKVRHAEDNLTILPNTVYLIPPKRQLTVYHGKLYLTEQPAVSGINLPIDILFRSLARDQEEKAIAVILSGTGTDGTLGGRVVKEVGGLVIVQSPDSAQFDGMPRSAIQTGIADCVLAPERMPEEMLRFLEHPYVARLRHEPPSGDEEDALRKILALIRQETGVDFAEYKSGSLLRRIQRRMSVIQIGSMDQYLQHIVNDMAEIHLLYSDLLIGVTRFFRDKEAFDKLRDKVLPEIFSTRKQPTQMPLRVWVSACSTGEEVYTLAILLAEHMERTQTFVGVKIFASDVDKNALNIASAGRYPASILADVPMHLLGKYFFKVGDYYQVVEKLRKMIIFAHHNLLKDPPFHKLDLIACRNMLIYIQTRVQKRILSMFSFALNQNGFLFLGGSETLGEAQDLYWTFDSTARIFRNKGDVYFPEFHTVESKRLEVRMDSRAGVSAVLPFNSEAPKTEKLIEGIYESLMERYVPASVVIDPDLNILHVWGDINEFVRFPKGNLTYNLLRLLDHKTGIIVSNAVRNIQQNGGDLMLRDVQLDTNEGAKLIRLTVTLHRRRPFKQDFFIVTFSSAKEIVEPENSAATTVDYTKEAEEQLRDMDRELQHTRESLQTTIEELETTNEELQSTNEELMSANEELQSTNEELHSVNEELYTLNEEYQKKIEELTNANNDLNNLYLTTNIGIVFLDRQLCIRKFTPIVTEFLPLMEQDVGRPIAHLAGSLNHGSLMDDLRKVLKMLVPIKREIELENGKWYQLEIKPYQTIENQIDGAVITLMDITELHSYRRQQHELLSQLEISNKRLSLATEVGNVAWWEWNYQRKQLAYHANKANWLGFRTDELVAVEDFTQLIHPDDYEAAMQSMRNLLTGQSRAYDICYRLRTKQGSYRWFQDQGFVTSRTEDGAPELITGAIINLDEPAAHQEASAAAVKAQAAEENSDSPD
jgi:two-component system CheB/CheR fusion protein